MIKIARIPFFYMTNDRQPGNGKLLLQKGPGRESAQVQRVYEKGGLGHYHTPIT